MQVQVNSAAALPTKCCRLSPLMILPSVPPLQALHNENQSLKAEIENLQAQISDQVSEVFLFRERLLPSLLPSV